MIRSVIAIALAGAGVLAASAWTRSEQAAVLAPSVYASQVVRSGAIRSSTVACPAGFVATSGGIFKAAPGTTLLASTPLGLRAYRFTIGNPATNPAQRVTVVVACRKIRSATRQIAFKARQLTPKRLIVPPGKAAGVTLNCPRGTVPAQPGANLGTRALLLRRQSSTLSSVSYGVLNRGGTARGVRFYGGCLTLARAAGAPVARLHVATTTFRVPLHPGSQTVTRRCRPGWFSLASGFSLTNGAVQVTGAAAVAGKGRWLVTVASDAAVTADLQLTCGLVAR